MHIGGWNGLVYAWAMLSGLQSRSQFLEQIMLGGRLVEDDADVQPVAAAEHAMNRAEIFSVVVAMAIGALTSRIHSRIIAY